jgi:MarR family transcriptional regulator, protease production regulatory protein HPr
MQDLANVHLIMNHFRGAYKVLEEEWQKSAKQIGLTQAEQHIIWIVSLEKEATITRIAELGLWDVSTVMQVVKRLKEKGYIVVKKKTSDRRISYVVLTESGNEKKKESEQHTYRLYDFIKKFLNKSEKNATFLGQMLHFYEEVNQHFYGREFVNWIDSTYKGIANSDVEKEETVK